MSPISLIPPEAPTIPLEESLGADDPSQIVVSATASIEAGTLLAARYRLTELLGEGGTSRVYKASDLHRADGGERSVIAVKVLTRPFPEAEGRFASLYAEVARWRRLAHPNIAALFDCERDGSVGFITMEYLAGESTYAKLNRRAAADGSRAALDGEEARLIIASVAEALEYAHQQGVVHGDLKPGNVIVTDLLQVKVIDFGMTTWFARPIDQKPQRSAGAVAVTPSYASPQLLAGEEPKPSDDVFGLACFAYEILTGVHPSEGVAGARRLELPPPLVPGLSPGEYAALVHGLQMERANRPASIRDFMAQFAAQPRRSPSTLWPIWLAIVAVAGLGWIYFRPSADRAALAPPQVAVPSAQPQAPPPAAASDKPGTVIQDCATCPSLTVLPPGQFEQGAAADQSDALPFEKPQRLVHINYPLAMSTTDISVDDFRQFVAAMGRDMQGCDTYDGEWRHRSAANWKQPGFDQSGRHPVTCISWDDAVAYAEWLSGKTGHRYRLPSASEWEYAARAGGAAVQPWNSDAAAACGVANVADQSAERRYPGWKVFPCDDKFVYTAPAGSFKANAFGLKDMLGNVLVWTEDCWQPDYSGAPSDGSAREEPNCREHELRGGSWFSSPPVVKSSYRNHFAADYRTSSVGFRIVRDVD